MDSLIIISRREVRIKSKHKLSISTLEKASINLEELPANKILEENFHCLAIDTDSTDLLYTAKLLAKVMVERPLMQIIFFGKLEGHAWLQLPVRLEKKGQILLIPVREVNETFIQSFIFLKNSWRTNRKLSQTMLELEETLNQQQQVLPRRSLETSFPDSAIEGYEILDKLGEGNTGLVYLARSQGQPPQTYAIKILKSMHAIPIDEREESTERFIREAEVMEDISHPNIVKIIDSGLFGDEQRPYIVMEYVEGKTLRDYIEQSDEALEVEAVMIIASKIAAALEEIHDEGFCHRDIKPDNIIISKDDEVKLMDFGLASLPDSTLTLQDNLLGSPAYMSPEAYTNADSDPRSDLFSLGVLMYECLTKRLPWKSSNLAMLAYESQHLKIIRPAKRNKDIPFLVDELVMKLLSQDPDDRYQSAEDTIEALRSTQLLA